MKNYVHRARTLIISTKGNILDLPDISLAKEMIAWEPSITLGQSLNLSISYFDRLIVQEDI